MAVLVTGSTGTVGSEVVKRLSAEGVDVRALSRSPEKADFPDGVTPIKGDMLNIGVLRSALDGVDGLFLLSAVVPDELTQTLLTLSLAQQAGVRDVVYLSVLNADRFTDPPHFAAKAAAERMIADAGLAATILRPGYYMQNDLSMKDPLREDGIFASPVGNRAVLAVDVRDLGDVAAVSLLRREKSSEVLPPETIDVVSPEVLTGDSIAEIWADVIGRPVSYAGDDLDRFEEQMSQFAPAWMAHDMRLMMQRFQRDGLSATPGDDARLQALLGRPMRSYREFATEAAASWKTD